MKVSKIIAPFVLFSFLGVLLNAQGADTENPDKAAILTLEDIWASGKLFAKTLPGFKFGGDDKSYLILRDNKILVYDITSGEVSDTLLNGANITKPNGENLRFSSYIISSDGNKFLLETNVQSIYRYSKKAEYFVWDQKKQQLTALHPKAPQMYPTFSPKNDKVAFVSKNDVYYLDLNNGKTTRVSYDGLENHIINGASDWVYEEEFGLTKAFEWSPDGKYLAYIQFDETLVPEFSMELYNDDLYPERVTFKYPKVGERNAVVALYIFNTANGKTTQANLGKMDDMYIPRIKWSGSPDRVIAFKMNRHQNHLELYLTHPETGKSNLLLEEKNPYYIDLNDDMRFLETKRWFIWSSERTGYKHLYLYDMNGREIRALTSGAFDVTAFYGVDEKRERIFFQAADESPMTRNIYAVDLNGENLTRLNPSTGYNTAQFSSTFDYWVCTWSQINMPPVYSVYDTNGKLVREIENNEELLNQMGLYNVSPAEFFSFDTQDGVSLNGYMIKPADFDPAKQYPVFMFLYGGPNSQQVVDSWRGANYWWFQLLAQQGYLVACVDNRGTGARGEAFRKITYMNLGHYETIDQIEAAKYLGELPYTDASRIGIYGWSYGGYMSSLCLLKGNDVFKAAIAVAPVTNWKWYDTIYTERYMRTEKENPDGYKNNSPVYFADRLNGNYLLVHGMADDNVHFQHTVEMANALIKANKQFDTYFYPNKNHGIYGGLTRLHLFTKMTDFIKKNI